MESVEYVLFAVNSNKSDWMGYSTYWYDAMIFDFNKGSLFTVEWRGNKLPEDDRCDIGPFNKSAAEYLIEKIKSGNAKQIDVGNFSRNGKLAGKVIEKELSVKKKANDNPINSSADNADAGQYDRIVSLIQKLDSIDFNNKAFVFDRLEYVPLNGEFVGPDSPDHPIVKRVIEAGGIMRKSVSGKTDYLVIDDAAINYGISAKCRDTLKQIDKGKNIIVILLSNLLSMDIIFFRIVKAKYLSRYLKEIARKAVLEDDIEMLTAIYKNKIFNTKTLKEILAYSIEKGNTVCTAFLLECQS